MLCSGVVLLGIFLGIEWRFAKLPLLPAQVFRYGRSTNILLGTNIIIGWIYWGNLFLMPLFLQNVQGASPARAGALLLPMVVAHGLTSALTGIIISATGRYKPVIVCGGICWATGAMGKLFFMQNCELWKVTVIGILDGVGVGCSLQPGKQFSAFCPSVGMSVEIIINTNISCSNGRVACRIRCGEPSSCDGFTKLYTRSRRRHGHHRYGSLPAEPFSKLS